MLVRICSAAILSFLLLSGSAQAQVQSSVQPPQTSFRSLFKVPDPRGEFVRLCAPHMVGRWAHPESVCSCLHDYAAATVEDADLREALLRGISETGVPTIETAWVPRVEAVRDRPDLHQDRQADAAVHVRAGDEPVSSARLRKLLHSLRLDTPVTVIVSNDRSMICVSQPNAAGTNPALMRGAGRAGLASRCRARRGPVGEGGRLSGRLARQLVL